MAITTQKLLARLLESPLAQELRQQDAAERAAERKAHIKALAELEKQGLAAMPKLIAARDDAERDYAAAESLARQSKEKLRLAKDAVTALSQHTAEVRSRHQAALERSADPAIDLFLDRLEREAERLRPLERETTGSIPRKFNSFGQEIVTSNHPLIDARLRAITSAREATRALKHQAIDGDELRNRLDDIWDAMPSIVLEPK